jgi:hypothetical protein
LRHVVLEGQPVWIRSGERPPAKRISLRRVAERADVVVNHLVDVLLRKFLLAKLLPARREFPAILRVTKQPVEQVARQPLGRLNSGGVSVVQTLNCRS